MDRRTVLSLASGLLPAISFGQTKFPTGPVKLIVATAPGAGMDAVARLVGEKLSVAWNKPVIVENRPGGSGATAMTAFKNSRDTHTLLVGDIGLAAINPVLFPKLTYDPQRDLKPVTELFSTGFYITAKPGRFGSLAALIAEARAAPGKLNYGSTGVGSGQRLSMELLSSLTGARLTYIPYRGNVDALSGLIGGDVDVVSVGLPPIKGYLDSGRLVAIASTAAQRSAVLPEIPTVAETAGLKGFEAESWVGLFGSPTLSATAVDQIRMDVAAVIQQPVVKEFLRVNDYRGGGQPPAQLAAKLTTDREKYARLIKNAGITAE